MPSRKRLDLKEKEKLIEEASKPGFDRKKACASYGIGYSTLSGILKQKDSILNSQIESIPSKAKSLKKAAHPELEQKLYEWFMQKHRQNLPIDGLTIQDEAIDIAKKLGINDFKCSIGWVQKFKNRFEIKSKTFKGEKLSADHAAATNWIENYLPNLLQKYN